MITFPVLPHVGIGPIHLGATRSEVQAVLGDLGYPLYRSRGALDYFCEAAIQVEYGASGTAEFIGISCHRSISVTFHGTNVFDTPAEALFALIAAHEAQGPHTFNPCDYLFPEQILTLWDADPQYDRLGGEKRVVWAQIGVGNRSYLEATRTIEQGAKSTTGGAA